MFGPEGQCLQHHFNTAAIPFEYRFRRTLEGVETRELSYFVAVAEELNFGRAARRLGIAQPPLSRAITQFERRIGVELLTRSSRRVELTEAGTVLLDEARNILSAVAAAQRRTQQVAGGSRKLVLVAKAGASSELLTRLLDAYAAEPDAVEVDLQLCEALEQQRQLREGRADLALMHRPFDDTDEFDTEVLAVEGQVALLPRSHPLSVRTTLRTDEIAHLPALPMARWPTANGSYPQGSGVEVHNLAQLFQLVALGRSVTILPESACTNLPEDLVAVPVSDAESVSTVIAWPTYSRSIDIAHFVDVVSRH